MAGNTSVGNRILTAQANHCASIAAELAEARAAGASAAELADLEAQDLAARKRYQELAVDLPGPGQRRSTGQAARGRRPWWRFW